MSGMRRRGFMAALGAGLAGIGLGWMAPEALADGYARFPPVGPGGWGTVTHVLGPGKRWRAVSTPPGHLSLLDEYASKMCAADYGKVCRIPRADIFDDPDVIVTLHNTGGA